MFEWDETPRNLAGMLFEAFAYNDSKRREAEENGEDHRAQVTVLAQRRVIGKLMKQSKQTSSTMQSMKDEMKSMKNMNDEMKSMKDLIVKQDEQIKTLVLMQSMKDEIKSMHDMKDMKDEMKSMKDLIVKQDEQIKTLFLKQDEQIKALTSSIKEVRDRPVFYHSSVTRELLDGL